MRRSVAIGFLCAAAAAGLAGTGLAAHSEPQHADRFDTHLVTAYESCTPSGNATMGSGLLAGVAACSPAVPRDPSCRIGTGGYARVILTVPPSLRDIVVKTKIYKLEGGGCAEAQVLELVADLEVTADDCAGGADCTTVKLVDFPLMECMVSASGECEQTYHSVLEYHQQARGSSATEVADPRNTGITVQQIKLRRKGQTEPLALGGLLLAPRRR